jgi:hypothetical protein
MSVVKKRRPRFRVGNVVSFLYGPQRVSAEIIEDRGQLGVYGHRIYRVRVNFDCAESMTFELDEEDMDDPAQVTANGTPGPRQEFKVTYTRRGKTNVWTATTNRGKLHNGMKAKGAVAYRTGSWPSEGNGGENHATISVFLEVDPKMVDSHGLVLPDVWRDLTEEARQSADQMFRNRHPAAVIEHQGEVNE